MEKISVSITHAKIFKINRFRSSLKTFQKPAEVMVKVINGRKVGKMPKRKRGTTLLCIANFRIKSYEVIFSWDFY